MSILSVISMKCLVLLTQVWMWRPDVRAILDEALTMVGISTLGKLGALTRTYVPEPAVLSCRQRCLEGR